MKKILGLDLGTNSIGWALIEIDHENGIVRILGLGSRILPMDAGEIKDFESRGKIKSTAAQRTEKRGPRRLNERYILRRDRLHLVLNLLDALPEHYKLEIDFTNNRGEKCGQFRDNREPKMAYLPKYKGQKAEFLFKDSYQEMLNELNIKNEKGCRIPYDWTLYYLRQKALKEKISLEELAWVLLSYNQKRGYEKTEVEDKSTKKGEFVEEFDLRVKEVNQRVDKDGRLFFEVHLNGNDQFVYNEFSNYQKTFNYDIKEIIKKSIVNENGDIDHNKTEFKVIDIYELKIKDVQYEKDNGKHKYSLTYDNGWTEEKPPISTHTFKYTNALDKPFDYIVETIYDHQGNIKKQQGKERKLREPDLREGSNDWTLVKKKTEKETLEFNAKLELFDKNGNTKKYISNRIYNILKDDAKSQVGKRTKIIGGMFQVVDRDFYREELNDIIATQRQYHTSLNDEKIFKKCVNTLYPKNENHRKSLLDNKLAIQHLLVEDILLYQRPPKRKKSEISNCKYEIRYWKDILDKKTKQPIEEVDVETGEVKKMQDPVYHKAVSVSHPYFQEFRIWEKLHNLKLIQIEKGDRTNVDVTSEYFTDEIYRELFEKLNNKKAFTQNKLLELLKPQFKDKKEDAKNFVWNFPEDEELKGNETRVSFVTRFKRCGFIDYTDFLTKEKELDLWHYLYSVSYVERKAKDKNQLENKSVRTFFNRFLEESNVTDDVKEKLIKDFVNYPKFVSKYCAYSEKALKKLLPLIRLSENRESDKWESEEWYLKWEKNLLERKHEILQRINRIDFNAEEINYSEAVKTNVDIKQGELPFPKGLFNAFKGFKKIEDFQHLNLTRASYLVYGRHSELAQAKYWKSPDDIRKQLHQELKQHSLNNPVAEKVLLEMMQIVANLWEHFGVKKDNSEGYERLFDKIHLEVGRELKKSAKEKENESKRQSGNREQNKRIRQVLEEFLTKSPYNANPKNSDHFERLKIAEEGAEHTKNTDREFFNDKPFSKKEIEDILKKSSISKTDFEKYKLWIEQGYRSPYTGIVIKLSDLFDGSKYNIDHVFPQASITNDSLSNKVVCELEVNKLKSDQTGREFVNNPKLRKIYCAVHGREIEIVDDEKYASIVKAQFSGNKRYILLSKEIPKGFTSSQLNNARHISRKAMELLSHIVREQGEVEFRSKNVLPITGAVTGKLKEAWRLDEVWKELVAPRYIRLNKLIQPDLYSENRKEDKSYLFGSWQTSKSGHEYFNCVLDNSIREKDESYNIKRIDHRHHALDALIVALCTEEHVNYINNINATAKSKDYGKQKQIEKYRQTLKQKIMFSVPKPKEDNPRNKDWYYMKPGEIRLVGAENSLVDTVSTKSYFYKDSNSFNEDYKKMILKALQHTIVTFKQNLRVINKTVNNYWAYKDEDGNIIDKKRLIKQKGSEAGNKTSWAIRRSLGKGTYYGKIDVGERINKQLLKNADYFYENIDAIVDKSLKNQIGEIKSVSKSYIDFKTSLIKNFENINVECIVFKATSRFNSELNASFGKEKIKTISDTGIQKILFNHLSKFDTIELPFDSAIRYFDSTIEKQEIEAIVNDENNTFSTIVEFIEHLRLNGFKYNKSDYSKLNVFIEQISDRDLRNDENFKSKITEHPEMAFTPEEIDEMNKPENIRKLNINKKGEEKDHKPIYKVRTCSGFGKQRSLSENASSVKSKQYVVNDGDSNLYLGCYERSFKDDNGNIVKERKFKDIGLMDLIETLKQNKDNHFHPLPKKIFDEKQNEYNKLFALSPLDLVFVPTTEEIENPSQVDFNNLTNEQVNRIYKYVDGGFNSKGGLQTNFIPFRFSKVLNLKDLKVDDKKFNGEITLTTDKQKQQKTLEGFHPLLNDKVMIREICWKLKVDRIGNLSKDINQ